MKEYSIAIPISVDGKISEIKHLKIIANSVYEAHLSGVAFLEESIKELQYLNIDKAEPINASPEVVSVYTIEDKNKNHLTSKDLELVKLGTDFLSQNYIDSSYAPKGVDKFIIFYSLSKPVGFCIYEEYSTNAFFLSKIYVSESYRRAGVASSLINFLKELMLTKDKKYTLLGISKDNSESLSLFDTFDKECSGMKNFYILK